MIDEGALHVERELDDAFAALPLFRHSREEALGLLLAVFEAEMLQIDREYGPASRLAQQESSRRGLALLAREAFRRCQAASNTASAEIRH